jgi:hypothetical protein
MKSKIVLFFLFFFILVDEAQSQSKSIDTTENLKQILTKLVSLDSKLDSLDSKFAKFKNSKDCDKLKSENKILGLFNVE